MKISRRSFLKRAATTAAVAPFILPSRLWAAETKPNSLLTMGFIGMGIQSRHLLGTFLGLDTRVLAVCDVDTTRRNDAKKKVDDHYTQKGTATGECVVASVTLPAGQPTPVNPALYPSAPLPAERPPVSREHLASLDALGTPEADYDAPCAAEYVERVSDALPLYQGAAAWVHPAFFLQQANRALRDNVQVSPWIHVGSAVRHLGGARVGETLQTRGRVRSLFEKKGREMVELDLLVVAGPSARPVAHIRHTAIYRLPEIG